MNHLFVFLFMIAAAATAEAGNVAVVKLLRGDVELLTLGKTIKLKAEDWVEDGAVVKTADKSFVKLVFVDKSQMNIGPNSEMKIEKFSGKDSGVIDLVKGKIRSQVTKDYLQMDKDKSKLFIKTPNAVMGIRGTDFMISTNGVNTAAVLFEGEVVFNKLDPSQKTSSDSLEAIVEKGVRMHPGEFSVVERDRPNPTVPSVLNLQQRETLEKNQNFEADRKPNSTSGADMEKRSVVPAGISGEVVSNGTDVLKNEISQVVSPSASTPVVDSKPEGFVNGDQVKPANGSFVHLDSGVIVPPGPGAVLDKNTNTYIPSANSGTVTSDGSYLPPKNVEITTDGKVFVSVPGTGLIEVEKPRPVLNTTGVALADMGNYIASNPQIVPTSGPVTNDILNKNFVPSGLTDLSNFQRNNSGGIENVNQAGTMRTTTDTTIRVTPQP